MKTPIRLAGAAAAALTLSALDVRMGLWETTSVTNMSNMMAAVDTSKMSPEQKAQMEAMMKGMASKPIVNKSCMTKEKFEKQSFMQQRPNSDCTQTITKNTRTLMEATVSCTKPETITGQITIEAPSPTALKGTVKSKGNARGREINVTIDMTGKWLGADCGDVK
jgi:hypothetical protein